MRNKALNWFAASPERLAWIILVIGTFLSFSVYLAAQRWEARRVREDFQRHADNRVAALQLSVRERLHDAEVFAAASEASPTFDPAAFQRLAKRLMDGVPSVSAVEFIPAIRSDKLKEFQAWAQSSQISAPDVGKALATFVYSGEFKSEKVAFPLYLRVPMEGSESPGSDLGANKTLRPLLLSALENSRTIASPRLSLSNPPGSSWQFRLFVPVGGHSASDGSSFPRGIISVVLQVKSLVDEGWRPLQPVGLDKLVYDASSLEGEGYLYTQWSRLRKDPPVESFALEEWRVPLFFEGTFPVADRRWGVIIRAAQPYVTAQKTRAPESLLLGGLLLSVSVAGYIYLIGRRSTQLAEVNEQLRREVSERKALEKQFFRSQRLESIGTLAAGIAHDLNNILAPIIMGAQYLGLKERPKEETSVLSTIQASAQRGADIVQQVLTFARGIEGERVPVKLGVLVREMQRIVQETFPRNIQLNADIPADLWDVSADVTQLHQVLMNLCVNARDAMPDGGTLVISAENAQVPPTAKGIFEDAKAGSYVLMQVKDTGRGIPPAILEKVFDPFFTTKPVGEGTGLGLSTALGIVRSHGGFIDVKSEEGCGTTFMVYLPALASAVPGPDTGKSATSDQGKGQCVLVVDDEPGVRMMMQQVLDQAGYTVVHAANGKEALEKLASANPQPAVVVTDLMMPVMGGVSFLQTLRQMHPNIPVIGCTGWAQEAIRAKMIALGVNWIIPKPCKGKEVLAAVASALNGKR